MQQLTLLFWIVLCQLPALAGMDAVRNNMAWYHSLVQPGFVPPDWLFPIMWAVLYILLGIAAFLIVRRGGTKLTRKIMFGFIVQLIFNALWSPVFFGMHQIGPALVIVSIMVVLTGCLILHMRRVSHAAAWLMGIYLAWICYAWALNCAFLVLN